MKLHTALIGVGTSILLAALAVWVATERQSVLMCMAGVTLILTGALQGAQVPSHGGRAS